MRLFYLFPVIAFVLLLVLINSWDDHAVGPFATDYAPPAPSRRQPAAQHPRRDGVPPDATSGGGDAGSDEGSESGTAATPSLGGASPARHQQEQHTTDHGSEHSSHHEATAAGDDDPEPRRIHVALISHGWHTAPHYHNDDTIKGPTMSLKMCLAGILRHTTAPLSLYFVTGERDEAPIVEMLRGVRYARADLDWRFVRLDEAKLDEWMDVIGHRASHRTGKAGNIKFFYPLVFPALRRLLMLDTDVLIDHDLAGLWAHFARFEPAQLYAMAPQWQGAAHPAKDNQFNAGVMLLRLDRMRGADWLRLSRASIDNWHAKGMTPRCCTHGDQTVFHMVRFYRPGALGHRAAAHIPRHWNINKCHGYQGLGAGGGERLPRHMPYVGLVHLGCCRMCTKAKIGPRWARLVDALNGTDLTTAFARQSAELTHRVRAASPLA